MSKQSELLAALDRLNKAIPSIKGSLLSTLDGISIVQVINDQAVDPARVAAMSATAIGVGKRISESLKVGSTREISLQASEGRVFIYLVGNKACLSLVTLPDSNTGLIQLEVSDTIEQLNAIL
ncbi:MULTISPECIES: roadblock/LC7 domain-containing protein [Pseudomonas]|uniref:Roadblock/LC7 domain-containing protein n=1 Tax=Pseudomonas nitroreducens TaxID=46680 RepID=A0A6G6ISL7_PSENT|nr:MULTISPECIES: roadblock/LC7 domain-containing protein [Pseudomonas]MBG6287431.1 roadblock/LC7 domain-containing protein [Pseudomonas nitroreducens]MCJ1882090.1 roadblock/LC7 domain-containing protein [Pseudomonas nitroreducens]MCJ1894627.1 roadblock/LC7 domain-containing protein [Pseudomonas nitroreducens]MDG9854276.1 roadblock/LC7 domain-containing protein [Pseudomonas nitroreducens]MDH1073521.1 roadblock/LC7 domain-containing protein [Pseudomonas nitroreducens]